MNGAIIWVIAIIVLLFHVWACRRSPKFWYLGGILPLLWIGALVFLFFNGKINFAEDWKILVFPALIFILFWVEGQQAAKKKEMAKMKAKDIQK